jgi:hypothetical protein
MVVTMVIMKERYEISTTLIIGYIQEQYTYKS